MYLVMLLWECCANYFGVRTCYFHCWNRFLHSVVWRRTFLWPSRRRRRSMAQQRLRWKHIYPSQDEFENTVNQWPSEKQTPKKAVFVVANFDVFSHLKLNKGVGGPRYSIAQGMVGNLNIWISERGGDTSRGQLHKKVRSMQCACLPITYPPKCQDSATALATGFDTHTKKCFCLTDPWRQLENTSVVQLISQWWMKYKIMYDIKMSQC